MKKLKAALRWGLVISLVALLVLYFVIPEYFSGSNLRVLIRENANYVKPVYVLILLVKAVTILPTTPFVVAGILLFPDEPHFVMVTACVQVGLSATFHYYFSQWLDFDTIIEKRYKGKVEKLTVRIKKYGFPIVLAWAVTPVVPSDVIYYVAGATKMNFLRFISAIMIGAVMLLGVYVYTGTQLVEYLMSYL